MRSPSASGSFGRTPTRVIAAGLASVAILAGCTAGDRPAFSDWSERWDEAQLLVPTEHELVDGRRTYCDQLLGRLRVELTDLTPTPSESIDPAFDAWSDHLRTLAFECPVVPMEINAALSTIHQLEAEIDAVEP